MPLQSSTKIIAPETLTEAFKYLEETLSKRDDYNIILDFRSLESSETPSPQDLKNLAKRAASLSRSKRSLVIVSDLLTYDKAPARLNLAPTIQEAHDLIELEAIERSLEI